MVYWVAFLVFVASMLLGGESKSDIRMLGQTMSSERLSSYYGAFLKWSSDGFWELNHSKIIVDDMSLYAPCIKCKRMYGPKNPCSWILDLDVLKYDWVINGSIAYAGSANSLLPFNATDFCNWLSEWGGDMMFVGDSTMEYQFDSWRNQVLRGNGYRDCPASDVVRERIFQRHQKSVNYKYILKTYESGCRRTNVAMPINFLQYRDDNLVVPPWNSSCALSNQSLTDCDLSPWLQVLRHRHIALLVLNRGAHFVEDEQLVSELTNTFRYLVRNFPSIQIIWRNTPFGELRYHDTIKLKPRKEIPIPGGKYNYDKFEHQNKLIFDLIQSEFPSILYLDIFRPTVLRGDGHYDEIHLCVPGIMDTWLQILYNMLKVMLT